jgi:hypothetical protein
MREYCILWVGARDKALDRGLQMDLTCPMEEVCTGETCVYLSPDREVKENLEKLRQELNNHARTIGN